MRSSAGEHLVDIEGVTGSIPVASTIFLHATAVSPVEMPENFLACRDPFVRERKIRFPGPLLRSTSVADGDIIVQLEILGRKSDRAFRPVHPPPAEHALRTKNTQANETVSSQRKTQGRHAIGDSSPLEE